MVGEFMGGFGGPESGTHIMHQLVHAYQSTCLNRALLGTDNTWRDLQTIVIRQPVEFHQIILHVPMSTEARSPIRGLPIPCATSPSYLLDAWFTQNPSWSVTKWEHKGKDKLEKLWVEWDTLAMMLPDLDKVHI